ncbi:hypothetical protein HZS_5335 [Henneguya salminicola]|nr:hypothetical protein HZS_5335 [Henneguya salminicola]
MKLNSENINATQTTQELRMDVRGGAEGFIEEDDRTTYTVLSIILTHVRHRPIIFTDCFSSYSSLSDTYTYLRVNHFVEIIDSVASQSTNIIEWTWNFIKTVTMQRNRTLSHENCEQNQNVINYLPGQFQCKRKNNFNIERDLL